MAQCIMEGEEATRENVMTKKERIIRYHEENVYKICALTKGDKTQYYTKLEPENHKSPHKVASYDIEVLKDKIAAFYLGLRTDNVTVYHILEQALEGLEPVTASRHKQLFKKNFSSIADVDIHDLKEEDIRRCLQELIDRGIKFKAFNNAASTLNKIHDYCSYNHIKTLDIRGKVSEFRKCRLVGKKVFLRDKKIDEVESFNEEEARKLITYALELPDYLNLAIALLLTTGMRSGELLALTIEDVEFEEDRLRVNKMERTYTGEILDSCKDYSDRYVYLNSDAITVLNVLMELRMSETETSTDMKAPLFLNASSSDGKMHLRALDNRLRKLQGQLELFAGKPVRSAHDCRRTYASIQYLHGNDIKTIQSQLGHAKATQTWEYIKNVIDNETRSEKLAKGCIL